MGDLLLEKVSPSCSRHGTSPWLLWKHQLPPKEPPGLPAWAARKSPAGTQGCPKDEHMFNNPQIRVPKPSLAWPGPLLSPGAQTTQLSLKLGQNQTLGGWQGWEGLFSSAWELQNKGQTLWILSFSRLRGRALNTSPGAGSGCASGAGHSGDISGDIPAGTWPPPRGHGHSRGDTATTAGTSPRPRGHRHPRGDIAPCSRHLLPPSRGGSSICQPVYPPAPSWILHPGHGRSGSAPASSYQRLNTRPAQLPTAFSGALKAAGGSCFLLLR